MADGGTATTPGTALAVRATAPEILGDPVTIGDAAVRYLAAKRKRLTKASERSYTACLRDLLSCYPDRLITDFEPPRGAALLEDFLVARYGHLAGRTYNRGLSVISDFMHWLHARGLLQRDPTLTLERAKARQVHRTTFSDDHRSAILAANPDPREQIALRLLLDYGLRKGALRNVQLEHFDHDKRRLTIFTKGEKIFVIPIPDGAVWANLDLLRGMPHHYLLPKTTTRRRTPPQRKQLHRLEELFGEASAALTLAAADDHCAREIGALTDTVTTAHHLLTLLVDSASTRARLELGQPIGDHGAHLWWYRCLARAGVVEPGTTKGRRMHSARHTAIQRVLEGTGNLKMASVLAGHSTVATTGDIYTGVDERQLNEALRQVIPGVPG